MPIITTHPEVLILVAVTAYLVGSIPFGMVMARLFRLGDLRKIGSGNIGATNVLRTGNKPAAFLTLVLDAAKGGIAVLVARAIVGEDAASNDPVLSRKDASGTDQGGLDESLAVIELLQPGESPRKIAL